MVLTACATRPAAFAPVVHKANDSNAQAQSPPPQTQQPVPVTYNYEQHSWRQSAPTDQWKGYVPTGYQRPPNNAFDAAPAYSGPYAAGYCAPGLGLSVGFGIGGCSVGLGSCGIYAGVGLGCYPIGVGFGSWCN